MPAENASFGRKITVVAASILSVSAASGQETSVGTESRGETEPLEEIIVTAQKRSERLMDVPTAISAVAGERLKSLGVDSLSDLGSLVPGLSIMAGGAPGYRTIVLRGLNTGYYNTGDPLTATYINDLPVGGGPRPALFGLDLNPYDVERIEVLKGPQGTLYGASTMGGLVKYVLREPSLREFEGQVGGEFWGLAVGSGLGWSARGAISAPIVEDILGLRVSAFHTENPGYIDNVQLGIEDGNESTQTGGMARVLWQPSDRLTLHATVLAQETDVENMAAVLLDGGTLLPLHGSYTAGAFFEEPSNQETRLYTVGIDWDVGFATVTSSTGWSTIDTKQTEDFSVPFGTYCVPGSLGPGWAGCPGYPQPALTSFTLDMEAENFVEEIRLTSTADGRFDWMLGFFYSEDDSSQRQILPGVTQTYEPLAVPLLITHGISNTKEKAAFATLTYNFTERFDVSVGGRYAEYEVESCSLQRVGILSNRPGSAPPPPCDILPTTEVSLWKVNGRLYLNQDQNAMAFASVATSYRLGSGCEYHSDGTPCGNPVLGTPGIVHPDDTTNYEIGMKGSFFDRRLQLNIAAFYIDWTNIQLTQRSDTGFLFSGNGGTAVSAGFEVTAGFQVGDNLTLDTTIGYTDAHLTEDVPGAGGQSGDQLPGSPLWTGSLVTQYSHPLTSEMTLVLGGAYRYRDDIVNQFPDEPGPAADSAAPIEAQNIVDAYAALEIGGVLLRLFSNNVFNEQGYTGVFYLSDFERPKFVPIQPRTIGLGFEYSFY